MPSYTPIRPAYAAPSPKSNAQGQAIPVDTGILIIDDDRRVSQVLSFMLNLRGYAEVRSVRSAARAVAVADTFSPGIVFLDLELPDTETLDLAKTLRRGRHPGTTRLIALTSTVEHPLREAARSAGFERFLVKPCEQAEVDKILRLTLEHGG